ncbi:Rho guanine nucleotide exchange factor 8 [Apostasia shenzhenica]|uniref:Rho guanine nucleotide exchange factor 8 n=1 Tax=Apostasia shenzhenica TaxID=1088818 RepID=A0A2I0BAB5_9ASPA|nr:Rho guanine nucleotide exchange factor 8 [Apostasia shenzhenica]
MAIGRVMVRFLRKRQSWEKALQDQENMFDIQGLRAPSMSIGVQEIGSELNRSENRTPNSRACGEDGCPSCGADRSASISDIAQMKERFAKLLLGEDMSGCGKGVPSALALSNAITNLAASVFGEQFRLEPMSSERKARWRREIDLLLSVTDHIVEFVPSQQVGKDGTSMEIMTTKQRKDLFMNIPALRKLDAMLLGCLDNFKDQNEFWYAKREADESKRTDDACDKDDKWWLPTVKVPANGLSEISRKWLLFHKESANQVLKAALAINAQVLMEMEIPEAYIESLPKNGRASLGDSLYRSISAEHFNPEQILASFDLSTDHNVLDLKNRIEASVVIWKRKMNNKESKSWSSGVSLEKREQFEERAWTVLHILKHRFHGIPQSDLETSKIQFNRDVGQSVLESYSRIIESLAYTVISRIEDVLHADHLAQDLVNKNCNWKPLVNDSDVEEEMEKLEFMENSTSMTLSDFMVGTFENEINRGEGSRWC